MRVGFWASSRSDIALGSTAASLSLKGSAAPVTLRFASAISNPESSIARVFITGFTRTEGKQLAIRAYDKGIIATAMQAVVQVAGDMAISSITLNFVVFSPRTATFASYGGNVNENSFSTSQLYDLQKNIYRSDYSFYGLTSINLSKGGVLALSSIVDSDFYMRVDSLLNVDAFVFSYVIIGVPPAQSCAHCSDSFLAGDSCEAACPSNSFPISYPDGGKGCKICPASYNLVVNSNRDGCACRAGFESRNSICVLTQSSILSQQNGQQQSGQQQNGQQQNTQQQQSTQQNGQNTQTNPSAQTTTTAQTPSPPQSPRPSIAAEATNYVYVERDCSSVVNSYWNGYACACKPSFRKENGVCINDHQSGQPYRPAEFIYSLSALYRDQPAKCAKQNEVYNGEICVCAAGYERNAQSECVAKQSECPANSQKVGQSCVCNSGFVRDGAKCVKKECPENSFLNGIECICRSGYYMQDGKCIQGAACKVNSQRNSAGVCVCLPGFVDFGAYCARCPDGQYWMASEGKCVTTCGVNQAVNPSTNKCECKPGFGIYEGLCNVCPTNFFLDNGNCVTCPIGSTFSLSQGRCVCNSDYTQGSNGRCVERCPNANEVYSASTNSCRCFEGLARVNGKCEICSNGYIDANQNCVAGCKANEVLRSGQCVCRDGFGIAQNRGCVDCSTIAGGFLL